MWFTYTRCDLLTRDAMFLISVLPRGGRALGVRPTAAETRGLWAASLVMCSRLGRVLGRSVNEIVMGLAANPINLVIVRTKVCVCCQNTARRMPMLVFSQFGVGWTRNVWVLYTGDVWWEPSSNAWLDGCPPSYIYLRRPIFIWYKNIDTNPLQYFFPTSKACHWYGCSLFRVADIAVSLGPAVIPWSSTFI